MNYHDLQVSGAAQRLLYFVEVITNLNRLEEIKMNLFHSKPRAAKTTKRSIVLEVECLEERQLLTTYKEALMLAATYENIKDMYQLAAAQGVQRTTPTILWLNFDGGNVPLNRGNSSFQQMLPFDSATRERDIQDIIYRVSETFAPFNVMVMRAYNQPGSALELNLGWFDASNGNTTIFIGDAVGADGVLTNTTIFHGVTPAAFMDYPCLGIGLARAINSNPFDIALADSRFPWGTNRSNAWIAEIIAHEAGHTFGLAHVLSSASANGSKDNDDVMSYDRNQHMFANIPNALTDRNGAGNNPTLLPQWSYSIPYDGGVIHGDATPLTQNSFQFLLNVLGPNPSYTDEAKVADATAVDGAYVDGVAAALFMGSNKIAALYRFGDYHVYNLNAATSDPMFVYVSPLYGFKTVLMIYDVSGRNLLDFSTDYLGMGSSKVVFQPVAGQSYKLVVGGQDGSSFGVSYRLEITPYRMGTSNGLHTDPADYSKTALYVHGTAGADQIVIRPANMNGTAVKVIVNGVNRGVFRPTGHIYVYGKGGNDVIRMESRTINGVLVRVAVPTVVDAGLGNDLVHMGGSKANNILLGGAGRDDITGGRGRDLIIGGQGADVLRGRGGADLLIGNRTAFDANQDALIALMAEWGRTDVTYQERMDHLLGFAANGLNGTFELQPAAILDDAAVDTLYGEAGRDWFIRRKSTAKDKVLDAVNGEAITVV